MNRSVFQKVQNKRPVFVSEFHDDGESSDFSRPRYRCSNNILSIRVSRVRYSNLKLEGEFINSLLSLLKSCPCVHYINIRD